MDAGACESPHGNIHVVPCEARRCEYRLKYGRHPPVTKRRVYLEPERAPEGAEPVPIESNPLSDREKEQVVSYQMTANASAPTVTAQLPTHLFGKRATR